MTLGEAKRRVTVALRELGVEVTVPPRVLDIRNGIEWHWAPEGRRRTLRRWASLDMSAIAESSSDRLRELVAEMMVAHESD